MDCFDPELEFISGKIFDIDLPKEQLYLYRYFKTALQRMFVKYYLTYRSFKRFTDHTGYACSPKRLQIFRWRLTELEKVYAKAKQEGDFSGLALIESGHYSLKKGKNHAE